LLEFVCRHWFLLTGVRPNLIGAHDEPLSPAVVEEEPMPAVVPAVVPQVKPAAPLSYGTSDVPARPVVSRPVAPMSGVEEKQPVADLSGVKVSTTLLGKGSIASVYKGSYCGAPAAVKKIKKQIWDKLTVESSLHSKLHHPNIPHMYGIAFDESNARQAWALVVMEYCSNGSLKDAMEDEVKFDAIAANKKNIILGIAAAMTYLHSQGFHHGDLKPQNVLLASDYSARVADFGISKALSHLTPMYTAPEALEGQGGLKSDVYSFAFILWQLLTGLAPFDDVDDDHTEDWRPSLELPGLDDTMKTLISECWNADPTMRPSFAEVLSRVEDWEPI